MLSQKYLAIASFLVLGFTPIIGDSKINAQAQILSQNQSNNSLNLIEETWQNFGQLYANPNQECPEEKTAIPQMGLRGLYCHIKPKINYQKLQELAGKPIFLKGPHSKTELNLDSKYEFGYYNPEFVQWFNNEVVGTITKNPALVKATQPIYDQYIKNQVRSYYLVYLVINSSPRLREAQKLKYLELMETQTLPEMYLQEQFREFADEFASKDFSWYETNTAGGFWIRRSIDGTDQYFIEILDQLIEAFDPEF
jgi:hypothetical protein